MDKRLFKNLSYIFFCIVVILIYLPQTANAQAAKPMFYNVHYDESGLNSGGWI